MIIANALDIYNAGFKAGLKPDPNLGVTEWSDAHRMLPKKSSSEPGKYRSSRTPYIREPMDNLSPHSPVQDQCVMKGTQLGWTESGNNWFAYVVDVCPGPMMMTFPTVDLAKDHSKQKLAPTIEETPRLRGKIKENKSRDSGNTIQVKEFPGGILFLSGSNSGTFFRSKSIRYLFLDDIDGFVPDVDGEGDPIDLAKKRTDTFSSRKKIYEISTPTVKGISRIEKSFDESDQRYFNVPCPHCNEMQPLEWGGEGCDYGIKFKRDVTGKVVVAVWYECHACHQGIDESHKTWMLDHGEWIPTCPDRKKRGYHLSGLYSPLGWVSWRQIVEEFLEKEKDRERLKVWTNTRLGKTFEEKGDQPDWVSLKARCEPYEFLNVPAGGLLLTSGVDTQDNRLAIVIRAWGRGEESWLVYWGEIYGDPAQPFVWQQLDELLYRPYLHASGTELHIISMAVDSGGHHTQEVYNYARTRVPKVIAVKGASQSGKPIIGRPTSQDVTYMGAKIPGGVQLWPIGTDTAKSTIYSRLKMTDPGPGCFHFPIGTGDDYFMQLTAEKLITRYVKGYPKMEWVKVGPRNEALDCEVYCMAAAIRAGLARTDWGSLERTLGGKGSQPKKVPRKPEVAKGGWLAGVRGYQRPGWLNR